MIGGLKQLCWARHSLKYVHTGVVFQRLRTFAAVLCVLVASVSGCSSENSTPESTQEKPLTLSDLDMEGWTDLNADPFPKAPKNPNKTTAKDYDRAAQILHQWALATLGSPEKTLAAVPKEVRAELDSIADAAPARNVSLGAQFADGLAAKSVWGTGAWRETSAKPLHLEFQTRVLWELDGGDGNVRLVGLVRTHALIDDGKSLSIGQSWQEFGADDCALAIEEVIRPGGDVAEQNKDLRKFVDIANSPDVLPPNFSADDVVDDQFVERCRAGKA